MNLEMMENTNNINNNNNNANNINNNKNYINNSKKKIVLLKLLILMMIHLIDETNDNKWFNYAWLILVKIIK